MGKIVRTAAMALVAAGLFGAAAAVAPAPAKAGVYVRVGNGHHYYRHDRWRRHHRRHCRVVVRHEWRHGRRITVRRRVCW